MFPLNITALIFQLIPMYESIKVILSLAAFAWCSYSSIGFLKGLVGPEKRELVLYPVILFYLFLSFFVLMNH